VENHHGAEAGEVAPGISTLFGVIHAACSFITQPDI
jgi:hypothetical protein